MSTATFALDTAALADYDVDTRRVARLDNGGEPCQFCQLEGYEIQAQVYATNYNGDQVFLEVCAVDVPWALAHYSVDPGFPVVIEVEGL